MFAERPGLRIELHEFTERCVACRRNVHRSYVNELRDMKIYEAGTICSNKTYRSGSPDITLDMAAESNKRQRDDNGRQLGTWMG